MILKLILLTIKSNSFFISTILFLALLFFDKNLLLEITTYRCIFNINNIYASIFVWQSKIKFRKMSHDFIYKQKNELFIGLFNLIL